nr:immunoglobulin light chain junction region [Macaca mulatta]MOV35475.1 immunoglobulin light chain junction region [Macaca mulatta]
CMQSIEFPFSF